MLYDIGFFVFSLAYLPTLIFKGKLHSDFDERFGLYTREKQAALASAKDVIWIQAVSVGEVALCRALIPALRQRFPERTIVFSTVTKTGNDLAKKLYGKDAIVIYFPLDFTITVKQAVSKIRPATYVMIETEIWPNLLGELSRRGVPTLMLNGRISDRSFRSYLLARPFLGKVLRRVGAFCMQSDLDAERIKAIGAPPDRVCVTGSMKFDVTAPGGEGAGPGFRQALGLRDGDELFVAGSTHNGEEEAVLGVYTRLLADRPNVRLLIAPRHIERAGAVEKAVAKAGFTSVRVSRLSAAAARPSDARTVYILDSIGHLGEAFAASTIVFIGGSLVTHGGQNPLEAAALGKPVLFGPHMFNFRNIAKVLLDSDAAVRVADADDLFAKASALLADRGRMSDLGWNAKRALANNRGATTRNLDAVTRIV